MPVSALDAQNVVRVLLPSEFVSHLFTVCRSGSPRCGCCGCRCLASQLFSCCDRTSRPVQHLSSPGPLRLAEFMCSHGQVRASFRRQFVASYDLSLTGVGSGGCEGAAKEVSAMSLRMLPLCSRASPSHALIAQHGSRCVTFLFPACFCPSMRVHGGDTPPIYFKNASSLQRVISVSFLTSSPAPGVPVFLPAVNRWHASASAANVLPSALPSYFWKSGGRRSSRLCHR
jgi:hypothetical protein